MCLLLSRESVYRYSARDSNCQGSRDPLSRFLQESSSKHPQTTSPYCIVAAGRTIPHSKSVYGKSRSCLKVMPVSLQTGPAFHTPSKASGSIFIGGICYSSNAGSD